METYLIRFTVRPGQRERFLGLLTAVLEQMRKEKPLLMHVLPRSQTSRTNSCCTRHGPAARTWSTCS